MNKRVEKMDVLEKVVHIDKEATDFGFKWSHYSELIHQIKSECEEIQADIEANQPPEKIQEELGDLIHATLSFCLFMGFDPKATLDLSLTKFSKRFEMVKTLAKETGLKTLENQPMDVLMTFWEKAKESTC